MEDVLDEVETVNRIHMHFVNGGFLNSSNAEYFINPRNMEYYALM